MLRIVTYRQGCSGHWRVAANGGTASAVEAQVPLPVAMATGEGWAKHKIRVTPRRPLICLPLRRAQQRYIP